MRNKIYTLIKETLNPRLTTHEMENSQTRCGCDYQITELNFGDDKPHLPVLAIGDVNSGRGWIHDVTWNRYGECTVGLRRIRSFDLITPTQEEINQAKPAMAFLLLFILFVIISIIE